jgi:hypothetical protein
VPAHSVCLSVCLPACPRAGTRLCGMSLQLLLSIYLTCQPFHSHICPATQCAGVCLSDYAQAPGLVERLAALCAVQRRPGRHRQLSGEHSDFDRRPAGSCGRQQLLDRLLPGAGMAPCCWPARETGRWSDGRADRRTDGGTAIHIFCMHNGSHLFSDDESDSAAT